MTIRLTMALDNLFMILSRKTNRNMSLSLACHQEKCEHGVAGAVMTFSHLSVAVSFAIDFLQTHAELKIGVVPPMDYNVTYGHLFVVSQHKTLKSTDTRSFGSCLSAFSTWMAGYIY